MMENERYNGEWALSRGMRLVTRNEALRGYDEEPGSLCRTEFIMKTRGSEGLGSSTMRSSRKQRHCNYNRIITTTSRL